MKKKKTFSSPHTTTREFYFACEKATTTQKTLSVNVPECEKIKIKSIGKTEGRILIMPKCLMAKKWKAYPWPDRVGEPTIEVEEDEEIDVVGDSPANQKQTTTSSTCWGPSSPTAGATAPSPPPHSPEAATKGSTILYNGKSIHTYFINYLSAYIVMQQTQCLVLIYYHCLLPWRVYKIILK